MLPFLGVSKGPILKHYLEKDSTATNVWYSEMLANKLKPASRTKRRGLLSKQVLLLHDNAHLDAAANTVKTLGKLGSKVLEHPGSSPDLASSYYSLFGPLKEAFLGRRFASDDTVVHKWLCDQPKQSSRMEYWNKSTEKQGDYIEKLCTCPTLAVVMHYRNKSVDIFFSFNFFSYIVLK